MSDLPQVRYRFLPVHPWCSTSNLFYPGSVSKDPSSVDRIASKRDVSSKSHLFFDRLFMEFAGVSGCLCKATCLTIPPPQRNHKVIHDIVNPSANVNLGMYAVDGVHRNTFIYELQTAHSIPSVTSASLVTYDQNTLSARRGLCQTIFQGRITQMIVRSCGSSI